MKVMMCGDVVGRSGRDVIKKQIPLLRDKEQIDFVILNGENSANGFGITKKICENFYDCGVDVITSGNHIWDQKETMNHIIKEKRLLRPMNFMDGTPGRGFEIYKKKGFKIGVINLMGNVYMKKCENVFEKSKIFLKNYKLKQNYDFLVVDFHGEITSEKTAMGYFFDGLSTCVVGTHTHIPTADTRILEKGTGYQTDIGMCGDYNSVIGMNKENSLKRFFKDKDAIKHFPSEGEGTLSGIIVDADEKTGLTKKISRIIVGGTLDK